MRCRDQGRDSVRPAKPIFHVAGNTFRPIFFGYFITDLLLNNSAAGSFHTTKLCSRLYSIETEFYFIFKLKSVFEPPFGGLRGTVRTPSIARWKARGRVPIRH